MYQDTRRSLLIHGECVEEADMSLTGNGRRIAAIGSVVAACVLVLSGCGGGAGDDGTDTDTDGTTDTSTSTTDDTTTLTRPSTTATTIEESA
jgi:hypothetical protein